jgi:ABC-type glycerol-3-phosphate transport system substrate-binding protein
MQLRLTSRVRAAGGIGRVLSVVGAGLLLATACGSGGTGGGGVSSTSNQSLAVMSTPGSFSGLTKAAAQGVNSRASWWTYYHGVWAKALPNLKINEISVPDYPTLDTKLLLAENAGNPPDLVSVSDEIPQLVQKGELMNLTPFFKKAGISPSDFLGPMASYARYGGSWYALPAASGPSDGDLLVVPSRLSAAGLNPNNLPTSWEQLWQDTKKVTQFGPDHTLERIGEPVVGNNIYDENLYCGSTVIWNPKSGYQANTPCIKSFFNYEKRLVDFYGGWTAYNKFIAGDPGVYSCSTKSYIATGKELFSIDAYWTGGQMDQCYNLDWKLAPSPTMSGKGVNKGTQLAEWYLAIPKGAKNPQAAFDLWKATFYDNGFLAGPTTNGYVRPNQATAWDNSLIKVQAKIRKQHHFAGNPMASALKVVSTEAASSEVAYPRGTVTPQFTTIMTDTWNNIALNNMSVDEALQKAQQQINTQEHSQPGGVSAK